MNDDLAGLLARADLSPAARLVVLAFVLRHGVGQSAITGMAALVQMTGFCDRTVRSALKEAIGAGVVIVERSKGHGSPPSLMVPSLTPDHSAANLTAANLTAAKFTAANLTAEVNSAANLTAAAAKFTAEVNSAAKFTAEVNAAAISAANLAAPPARARLAYLLTSSPKEESSKEERKTPSTIDVDGVAPKEARTPSIIDIDGVAREDEAAEPVPKPKRQVNPKAPCPVDFTPAAKTLLDIEATSPGVDVNRELIKFVRYWTEGNGAGTRRPGWDQTFFAWCERAPRASAAAPHGARAAPLSRGRPLSPAMARLRDLANGTYGNDE